MPKRRVQQASRAITIALGVVASAIINAMAAQVSQQFLVISLVLTGVIWAIAYGGLQWYDRAQQRRRLAADHAPTVAVRPTSNDWHGLEQRFATIAGELVAVWVHYPESGRVDWQLYARSSGTERDRQRFEAEARGAGLMIARLGQAAPGKFPLRDDGDPVDRWLNAVAALVHPGSDVEMDGSGNDQHGYHESASIEHVAEASKIACALLASRAA